MKVYLVQNTALMPTSSYYDTLAVHATLKDAKAHIESLKNDLVAAIDKGHHECFKTGEYKIAFDDGVPCQYDKADYQMCFYEDIGYYDIYWIEEAEVDGDMKVFVLTYHGCSDYEDYITCQVFSTLSSAQMQMELEYKSEVEEYKEMFSDEEDITQIHRDTYCAVYEMGDYTRNHSVWEIIETQIRQ